MPRMLFISIDPPITPAAVAAAEQSADRIPSPWVIHTRVVHTRITAHARVAAHAIGLVERLTAVPDRTPLRAVTGTNVRHGTAALAGAENGITHRIEKSAGGLLLLRAAFEFLNAGVGAFECFVLHQHGLHEGVDGVRRTAQTLHDCGLRVRLAR